MATDKMLKKAAIELNDLMGLTPGINVKGSAEELTKGIKAAMKHITPEDEFSDATQEVIDEFSAPAKKAAPAPAPAKKKAPVVVEEDDDDDDEPIAPPVKKKKAPVVVEEDDDDDEPVAPVKKKKAPVVVEEDDDDDDEPVAPVKKGKAVVVEKKANPKFEKPEYSRIDAVSEALKSKPKTIQAWSNKADELIMKKGGKANPQENKAQIKKISGFCKWFDVGVTIPTV